MISLRVSAINLANTNRIENPRGFSEVGENKQLLIAIVPVAQVRKKSVLIIADPGIDRNLRYARKKGLPRKAVRELPAQ
ncbi:hypothetical protein [Flagellimonas lutimaris]|uniref:hypothetical protein n=1 Tax=Flagellimonas lutimaris TaxID=475082 RepID=UPI003F5CD4AA